MIDRVRAALAAHRKAPRPIDDHVPAAVLVPLLGGGPGGLEILLTRRTEHVRTHRGQIAFPGGRVEARDASLRATALRETHEEVGIPPEAVEVLGDLDDYVTVTGYHLTPVVGYIADPPPLVLQPSETDLAFTLPLADLLERGCDFRDLYFQTPRGGRWERVYTYRHGRHLVWGATARMLHALTCIVRGEQS